LLLFIYLILILIGLKKIGLWDFYLIKDTVFWLIGIGFILALNGISKDISFFKKTAVESIQVTILLEFIINLHVFSYFIEVTVLPILIFLGVLQGVVESNERYLSIQKFLNNLMGIFGIVLLIFGIYKTIKNFSVDFTYENLQSIILPSILTLLFIPFSYFVAVYSAYESLFCRLHFYKEEKWSKRRIKLEILRVSRFSLTKIHRLLPRLNLHEIGNAEKVSVSLRNMMNKSE
jgi:hypothetical protein